MCNWAPRLKKTGGHFGAIVGMIGYSAWLVGQSPLHSRGPPARPDGLISSSSRASPFLLPTGPDGQVPEEVQKLDPKIVEQVSTLQLWSGMVSAQMLNLTERCAYCLIDQQTHTHQTPITPPTPRWWMRSWTALPAHLAPFFPSPLSVPSTSPLPLPLLGGE